MLIGLVGKPSCGKSTFFKATTLIDVAIADYPFTTIKPNHGMGYVRVKCVDKELGVKCNPRIGYCKNGIRYVPVEIMDVAGLVPGAHAGKGLGNQFLNDLNRADVLIHIVDVSGETTEKGEAGIGDPAHDIRFLEEELNLWYLGILKRGWEKFARQVQNTKTKIEEALAKQLCSFRVTPEIVLTAVSELKLNADKPAEWSEKEMFELAVELRKRTKPILIACNKIDIDEKENFSKLEKEFPEYTLIECSADVELGLREADKRGIIEYEPGDKDFKIKDDSKLSDTQKIGLDVMKKFLKEHNGTGVQDVLDKAVFEFLKYIAIFPGGVHKLTDSQGRVLPDCFLLPAGSTAYDFAEKIHGDLAKHMLYAVDVRTKQRISKEHVLKHRDVIEIVSAAK